MDRIILWLEVGGAGAVEAISRSLSFEQRIGKTTLQHAIDTRVTPENPPGPKGIAAIQVDWDTVEVNSILLKDSLARFWVRDPATDLPTAASVAAGRDAKLEAENPAPARDWQGLYRALRGSAMFEAIKAQANQHLPVNTALTLLITALQNRDHEVLQQYLNELKQALVDASAPLTSAQLTAVSNVLEANHFSERV